MHAAIIATLATTAHPMALYVGGLDVIKEPGSPGSQFGADPESIDVIEAGPGGVSSMRFSIDDPGLEIVLTDDMEVQYWDLANSVPLFGGYVSSWDVEPWPGGQGRTISVICDGYEKILDDSIVPLETVITGLATTLVEKIQLLAGNYSPLRQFASAADDKGNQATPVGWLAGAPFPQLITIQINGQTLRNAIRALFEASQRTTSNPGMVPYQQLNVTVDFYKGLRVWADPTIAPTQPTDYATLTVSDTPGGALAAAGLKHTTDPGGIVRAVYVNGGAPAGSGWVTDGTGKPGAKAYLDDPTSMTTADLAASGTAYLGQFAVAYRGSFHLDDHAPPATAHVGGLVAITDVAAGLAASQFRLMEIRRTWNLSLRQNWDVTYGGLAPSAVRSMRRDTRAVLS